MNKITVIGPKSKKHNINIINTTSRSKNWSDGLSPFKLGPCVLYDGYFSRNMENAWQFSKVYPIHTDRINYNKPTKEYFRWAEEGWLDSYAHRYPMGKGTIPSYSYWDGRKLNYIEARKNIYVPLYAQAVYRTEAYKKLKEAYKERDIVLWDFDGYDWSLNSDIELGLEDVLNNSNKKMGHAFILAMMLTRKVQVFSNYVKVFDYLISHRKYN